MSVGGSPAGASGNPATSRGASAYQPGAQPGADLALTNLGTQWINTLGTNFSGSPGGWAYPQAQTAIGAMGDLSSPLAQQPVNWGENSFQNFQSGFGGLPNWIAQALGSYQTNQVPGMLSAADQIAGYAPQLAGSAGNLLNMTGENANALQGLAIPAAQQLAQGGTGVLQSAFDPQGQLQAMLQQQVQQQANAANAAAGLGGSAYGAGQTTNALSNFDINWQNQQLGRQVAGLGAAGSAFGQIPGLVGAPVNLLSAGTSGAINPLATAGNLATSPASALTAAFGPLGQGANSAASMYSQLQSLAGLPYNTLNTEAANSISNLSNTAALGNLQYGPTQQIMDDLNSYLGLGQNASALSGQLGGMGQQQLFNSLSGLGGAANLGSQLLTGNSLGNAFGSGGLLGLGGLNPVTSSGLGGLSGMPIDTISTDLAAGAPAAIAAGDFGGGGAAGGGLLSWLGGLLPFGAAAAA
jgi:hypothetical protein